MKNLCNLRAELKSKSNPRKAKLLQGFFKTGKGEYGEGDVFLGIAVPQIRQITKTHKNLKLNGIQQLLKSKYHEERLAAILILVSQFQNAMTHHSALLHKSGRKNDVMIYHNKKEAEVSVRIFKFYLKNARYINNWDLVDVSAPRIIGEYLATQQEHSNTKIQNSKKILYKLARSKNIWERRIAIISTLAFIKKDKLEDTLKISKMLLTDKHDLIHKSVGWMLREVGKRSMPTLKKFLKANCKNIHRTTLRYAIERFPEKKRKAFLLKTCS